MPEPAAPPSRTPIVGEPVGDLLPAPAKEPVPEVRGVTSTVDGPCGRISLERQGDGPPLLLLHPLALAGSVLRPFAARLAGSFDVICPDARGHGASDWDGAAMTMEALADDVAAVLDGLGLRSAHLLGMSMGGSVAMTFAGRFPDRVDRLVPVSTTSWYGPDAVAAWEERAERALLSPRVRQVPFQVDRWFTEGFRARQPDDVHGVVSTFLATSSRAHAAASRAMGALDARALLPRITAPVLAISGAEDYATTPQMGQYVADHVQHGTALTLDGLRHLSLVERPQLAELVAAHLRGAPLPEQPHADGCVCRSHPSATTVGAVA